jgi:mRNA interferase RelE/StbE
MDSYSIEWRRSATQELKKLPREVVGGILRAVEQLSTGPYPSAIRKLVGAEHTYRLRVGDYRIIFDPAMELGFWAHLSRW